MRNTLNYNLCRICKEPFVVGDNVKLLNHYCPKCETVGWLKEMREKGCTVGDPDKLGEMPRMVLKKKSDCPIVIIKGIKYIDVTELCFTDGRYKKTYPTAEEIQSIRADNLRKIEYKQRKARKEAMRKERENREEVEKMKKTAQKREREERERTLSEKAAEVEGLLKLGYTGAKVAKMLGISTHKYNQLTDQLKKEGKFSQWEKKGYTLKEEIRILELSDMGYTAERIGKEVGRTPVAIREKLKRLRSQGRFR